MVYHSSGISTGGGANMKTVIFLVGALVLLSVAPKAHADANTTINSAQRLCAAIDGTGLASEKCSISAWHSSVDMRIDTNTTEARKMCQQMVELMREKGFKFDAGWQIRIYSPYSGDHTLTTCPLN